MRRQLIGAAVSKDQSGDGSGSDSEGNGVFELTPHKMALCHFIHTFFPPAYPFVPFPFQSVAHHNRLCLFLFTLTRSYDGFTEPTLHELVNHLKAVDGETSDWLTEQLVSTLAALSSPDDLFSFFDKLRGVLVSPENVEDDQIFLDPNSHLGTFLRSCLLAFNLLSFEGVCYLLTNIGAYCKSSSSYDLPEEEEGYNNDPDNEFVENEEVDLESPRFEKFKDDHEIFGHLGESSTSHHRGFMSLYGVKEDIQVSLDSKGKHRLDSPQNSSLFPSLSSTFLDDDHPVFLRSKSQVEGYLNMQAYFLEKYGSSFSESTLNAIVKQIRKLDPDLHRVQYLQYLNGLYHDDYTIALDNLHSYSDYTAGMEGFSSHPASRDGKYETALLCLGTLQCHFGHPKKALVALSEAVRISQENNDDFCLAYTLAAICNILSDIGISRTPGIVGSPYSVDTGTGFGTPLSMHQQFLVLLERSIKRANSLKMICLLAFNRLALAKFDLKHVVRPLISFGPKASAKLRTNPSNVCKELRLSSRVTGEFGSEGAPISVEDGSFSTSWIMNLSSVDTLLNDSNKTKRFLADGYNVFKFGGQPNPIPTTVIQVAGASYLLRASSWELYGSAPLVRINSLAFATCFGDASSSVELSLAYIKLIQHLAAFKGYKEAFAALKLAEKKFLSLSKSRIQLLKLQLLHEYALHRGHLKVAQRLCNEFGVLASSVSGVDMELKSEASLRHARTLLAANQFSQAAAVAHSLFCTCYKFNMQIENANVLLLLAEIHRKSGNAVLGLPYALATLSFCQSFNLDLLEASATLTLAELWLTLGSSHAKRALSLVYNALPMILGHGGLELRGRANLVAAKCHLSDPDFSTSVDWHLVLDFLRQAVEDLDILQYHEMAAEAYYLMAMVYDSLGHLDEREGAAASFRSHIIALENLPCANEIFPMENAVSSYGRVK